MIKLKGGRRTSRRLGLKVEWPEQVPVGWMDGFAAGLAWPEIEGGRSGKERSMENDGVRLKTEVLLLAGFSGAWGSPRR